MNTTVKAVVGFSSVLFVSLLLTGGCASVLTKESDQAISMQELPTVVRTQAEKEIAGGKLIEVERETEAGKVVYAVTYYDPSGTKMEVEYTPEGKLLSKGKE